MSETHEAPTVAVVTVSFNSADALGPFLASVPGASSTMPLVVVVDNASPTADDIRSVAAAAGAHLLELPQNVGYGAAMNRGIAGLPPSVRWVLISNPDVILQLGAIDELVAAAAGHPDAAAIGPKVLQPDGSVYPSARRQPSLRAGIGHAIFSRAVPGNPWTRRYRADELPGDVERAAGWLSGSCLLVSREVFARLEGFDEGYFMYFEDVDLGARISAAGYTNLYWPRAVVTHSGAHSTAQRAGAMERAHHVSAYRFVARKYHQRSLWPLRIVLRAGIAARGLFVSHR